MKHTLSLLLLLTCGSVYTSDGIKPKQWNTIKEAIFKKMGQHWAAQFYQQYPSSSETGIRVLAQQFDFTEDNMNGDCWLESNPPQLEVKVNHKTVYGLTSGKCTDIICEVRQEIRLSKLPGNLYD